MFRFGIRARVGAGVDWLTVVAEWDFKIKAEELLVDKVSHPP